MPLRLDPVATASFVVTLAAPIATYVSIRLARGREHDRHRLVQAVLVVMAWLAVLAFELRLRLDGGAGAFLAQASPELVGWAQRLLWIHISVAVATYALWTWLAVTSWRRYGARLPGGFSRRHKRIGIIVFGGLCFTAASATAMFSMAFIL
jgi:putative membrane protein